VIAVGVALLLARMPQPWAVRQQMSASGCVPDRGAGDVEIGVAFACRVCGEVGGRAGLGCGDRMGAGPVQRRQVFCRPISGRSAGNHPKRWCKYHQNHPAKAERGRGGCACLG
jgi:hypothetical protein